MLTRIGTRALPSDAACETAVGFLLACHERMRRFTLIAAEVARADFVTAAQEQDVRDSARAVARFFRVAAPLHVLDEEQSLLPRLRAVAPVAVLAALQAMHDEHPGIEETAAALASECAAIGAEPAALESRRTRLAALAAALTEHWARHLPPEEQIIFPAVAALLSVAQQAALLAELRARRAAAGVEAAADA